MRLVPVSVQVRRRIPEIDWTNPIVTSRAVEPRCQPQKTISAVQKLHARRQAAGLCRECGQPRQHFKCRCDACQAQERQRWRAAHLKAPTKYPHNFAALNRKRRQRPHVYLMPHGMSTQGATGFDLLDIMARSTGSQHTLAAKMQHFRAAVEGPLRAAVEHIRQEDAEAYQRNCVEIAPLGLIASALEDERLLLASLRFTVVDPQTKALSFVVEQRQCPGADCPKGEAIVLVGGSLQFQQAFRENWAEWSCDPIAAATRFVESLIQADPIQFGPPVDVLQITATGPRWVRRKHECDSAVADALAGREGD